MHYTSPKHERLYRHLVHEKGYGCLTGSPPTLGPSGFWEIIPISE